MKTEHQTPRKAFQCPLPRRGSPYNGAWISAMSQGGEKPISFHLTQFGGHRRRLMSSLCPWSHRYHFPNQVTKLVLKPLQRGQADLPTRHPRGHMATVPVLGIVASASAAEGVSWLPLSLFGGLPFPECLMPRGELGHCKERGQQWHSGCMLMTQPWELIAPSYPCHFDKLNWEGQEGMRTLF